MKRIWTIIGVSDVPTSLKWYQSLFGQPETPPDHADFGQILDGDGTVPPIVRQFVAEDADRMQRLILGIQREEFGVPVTLEEQPDLRDIPTYYQKDHGAFWVAVDGSELVGTIGLLDIGHGQGALRTMFVAPSHRGAAVGVGATLLRACLDHAATAGMHDVLLGTTEQFRAAYRFYEKWGFVQIPRQSLPDHFPRMRLDTRFYRYHLGR
jgi:GNAT superfamily N-acetyltransferase